MKAIQFALHAMIFIFACTIVFHLLVLTQVLPYTIVWGGKLKSIEDMFSFEIASIFTNILFLITVLIRAEYIKKIKSPKFIKALFWLMMVLFLLNTIGNLFAETNIERYVFTPITFILFVLSIIVIKNRKALNT
jgi:hypothetical protein